MFRPLHTAASLGTTPYFATLAMRAGVAAHQPRLYVFSGVSGHLARAGVDHLAAELGLKVHRIDLSRVTSRFIGETEKNLARAFAAAPSRNAILFFDEADAIFGKRSEVRDAHDRYANLEVAHLLQRLEAYAGPAALATRSPAPPRLSLKRRRVIVTRWPP
jgi:SpoVK/Ycf46/Vps4 family AAA+-type ATPase